MVRQVAGNSRALISRSSQRHPTFTRMMITTPLLPGLIYIIFTFSWNFRSIFFFDYEEFVSVEFVRSTKKKDEIRKDACIVHS